jgi:hypothetical protein
MVKIRYADLPAGLHVVTEAGEHCTIVYLKPGLTRAQRRDALTVARRSARFGHGPSLPALDMAFALAADRTRTTARMTAWAIRKHPLLLVPLLAFVLGFIAVGVAAAAAVITVPPRASSAQSNSIDQINIARLVNLNPVNPRPSATPGPGSGVPAPGPRGSGHGGHGQLTAQSSHSGRARHGSGHGGAHESSHQDPRGAA